MYVDLPSANSTVAAAGFVIAGWAVDRAASSGAGVDAIHVWAYPAGGGAPVFVGLGATGIQRPDVAAFVGRPSAEPSGFGVHGSLPIGDYTLVVFARSVLTGTFNNAAVVPIRVR